MTNLFNSFDPTTFIFSWSLNWMSILISILFIPMPFWLISNRMEIFLKMTMKIIHNEFKVILNNSKNSLMFISLFIMILMNNLLGLMPFIFTGTSHILMTLSISLPLWTSFMIFGWINNSNHMFIHLVPQGTPSILMPFMVCIETISNIIRPGTLAIRLSANMIAGHLILTLLGNTGNNLLKILMPILIVTQFALLTLESAVAFIQSYVFTILSTLYSSEVI
uniref:ATP synthase subunit a n=1 Tax=Tenomerga trabecula TaxID=2843307 RepID=A0A8F0F5L6_9COLE|nr:ATP synthase F0 subunit 6 [Tenomerga trabecula]